MIGFLLTFLLGTNLEESTSYCGKFQKKNFDCYCGPQLPFISDIKSDAEQTSFFVENAEKTSCTCY